MLRLYGFYTGNGHGQRLQTIFLRATVHGLVLVVLCRDVACYVSTGSTRAMATGNGYKQYFYGRRFTVWLLVVLCRDVACYVSTRSLQSAFGIFPVKMPLQRVVADVFPHLVESPIIADDAVMITRLPRKIEPAGTAMSGDRRFE